jgi:hypothetical protein
MKIDWVLQGNHLVGHYHLDYKIRSRGRRLRCDVPVSNHGLSQCRRVGKAGCSICLAFIVQFDLAVPIKPVALSGGGRPTTADDGITHRQPPGNILARVKAIRYNQPQNGTVHIQNSP